MDNYIRWIRSKTGTAKMFTNFAGALIVNEAAAKASR